MSRLDLARPAVRTQDHGRLMISGPPGCGKSRTALIVGQVLADGGDQLLVDSQHRQALALADDFQFTHLSWSPPFSPLELAEVIDEAGHVFSVVTVDSVSPFWRGPGGVFDIASARNSSWDLARQQHGRLVDAALSVPAHVIFTVRTKVERAVVEDDGRWCSRKVGMGLVADDDLESDMGLAIEMDMDHSIRVVKSTAVSLPVGAVFAPGRAEDLALAYREWLTDAEPLVDEETRDALLERMNALPEARQRAGVKQEFLAQLGRPEFLRESQLGAAHDLVALHEQQAGPAEPMEEVA